MTPVRCLPLLLLASACLRAQAPDAGAVRDALAVQRARTEHGKGINRAPGRPVDPKVREFIRYVLSREGQQDVVRDGKILPLTGPVVGEQLRKLD